jgi:ACS family glucarate transporter-like MFS transporter
LSTERATRVRWGVVALLFAITAINYADRATFSIAGDAISRAFALDPVTMGYILSASAWAYVIAQLPGGALLDWLGSKRVYFWAILLWSIATALQGGVGLLAWLSVPASLFALRFLVGLFEAPSFPANARIVAAWFPANERGAASAIFNSAQYFALVLFSPLMGWLAHSLGWRSVFVVMGALGLVAAVVFVRSIHSPARHPRINAAERAQIETGGGLIAMDDTPRGAATRPAISRADWRLMLGNRTLIGIYLAQYGINVLTYFFTTWFPIYLVKERHLDIQQAGFAAALPALGAFAGGLIGGYVSDWLLARTGSLTWARKIPMVAGMVLAMSIVGCIFVQQLWLIVALMSLAFFGKGVASLGWAVIADVMPRRLAGLTAGTFNMFGNIAGIVTPIVIGFIVAATGSFDGALLFVGANAVLVIVAVLVVLGKVERVEG